MWDLPLDRPLTLGQLILLNRLRAHEHIRRAIRLQGGALRRHAPSPQHPPLLPITVNVEVRLAGPLVEIKGLGNAMAGVRDGIRGVRKMVADLNDSAGGLSAELKDVQAQIEQARADLKFEAQTLGNSPPESNGSGG